jgi:response regulator RpfG family c-di-GMP phosphodiesterase
MENKILFVDDDNNILSGFRRQFHGKFAIYTAESGAIALDIIKKDGPFEVVISDYKMPSMNGSEFLENVRSIYPDTVRIMLSGQADMQELVDVINKGNIFRFLNKPCPPDLLTKNIEDAIQQYNLIRAEKDLLEKTLGGSIKLLVDILSVVSPVAFGKALRVRALIKKYVEIMELKNGWQLEVAALLSQIGCITISDYILKTAYKGESLTADEFRLYIKYPQMGSEMIANIPRLGEVSRIIAYQEKMFNGSGYPEDSLIGEQIPFGARLLKIANDYDVLIQSGRDPNTSFDVMKARVNSGWYDGSLVANFIKTIAQSKKYKKKLVTIEQLTDNMILAEDIFSEDTKVIAGHTGQIVTKALRMTLLNFKRGGHLKETVSVIIPVDE